MKIYTSYFAKIKKIPNNIVPIAICAAPPKWWNGICYKKLAPKYGFFKIWKETQDNDYYIKHFNEEVLNLLNKNMVLKELETLSNGKDIVLICYESPEKFCHRHLVAQWLGNNVKEWI